MAKRDILLVIPPFDFAMMNSAGGRRTRSGGYYLFYPPLGLCSIAASAASAGFSCAIADGQFERGWPGSLAAMVRDMRPALVGVLTTTPTLPVVRGLISLLRNVREAEALEFSIVAGGPHISCDPLIVPELGADYGVVGDGETPVAALAAFLIRGEGALEKVPGLVWMDGESLRMNEPEHPAAVRSYPPPARELLNRDKYYNPLTPEATTSVISARGCPFQCSFCCRSHAMGIYRPRPVDAFLEEMRLVRRQGYGFVSVIDETFTFEKARAAEIAEGLLKDGPGFKWSCQTRADTVDAEIIALLARAGCINISFGVEAGDPGVRRSVEKDIAEDDLVRAFSLCRRNGITTNAFIMIGNPGEGEREIRRSIRLVKNLGPDYAVFNIGTLFPGSGFYEELLKEGKINRDVWTKYMLGQGALPVLSDRLGKPELVKLLQEGFSSFYLRPGYVMGKLRGIRSPGQALHLARQAGTIVGDYVFR